MVAATAIHTKDLSPYRLHVQRSSGIRVCSDNRVDNFKDIMRGKGTSPKRGLLSSHEIFECLHRLDLQDPLGLDLDCLARRGVATSACRTRA